MQIIRITVICLGLLLGAGATAADPQALSFVVPPASHAENAVFAPLRDHLARALGLPVRLEQPPDWAGYAAALRRAPALVFGPPHVIAWLAAWFRYEPVAGLPGRLRFITFVRRHQDEVVEFREIGGRHVCGEPPPGLGGVVLARDFTDLANAPLRAPRMVRAPDAAGVLRGVREGRCVAGLLTRDDYLRLGGEGDTRVIHQSRGFPNYAFAASGLLERGRAEALRAALLAAGPATRPLGQHYGSRGALRATGPAAFTGLEELLAGEWEFRVY